MHEAEWKKALTHAPLTTYAALPFDHPLCILYTSGTTGKPKCLVHGAGGTLIQHLKELRLHTDLTAQDVLWFHTTTSWMMWNWMVSGLAVGATLVLYEGSPFYPTPTVFWDYVDQLGVTVLGVGAKYLEAQEKGDIKPVHTHQLTTLRQILTTGSPLLPASFDYVYRDVKPTVQLSSISGGTDIISCFLLGNPLLPVYCGELQAAGLGMDMVVFNAQGHAVVAEKGELVCSTPFPSRPLYFWNDPDGTQYQQAYFNAFPKVWTHGDYAEQTPHHGFIIYGRSDATLKPGGVRVGTAEIYQQLETIPEIVESVAVGEPFQHSERIILFVILQPGYTLTDELCARIKQRIREQASPHHVPALIYAVPDIPRTPNGKISEIAVKKTLMNEPVLNVHALANPESLQFFHRH